MTNWVSASQIQGLFAEGEKPPPIPPPKITSPPKHIQQSPSGSARSAVGQGFDFSQLTSGGRVQAAHSRSTKKSPLGRRLSITTGCGWLFVMVLCCGFLGSLAEPDESDVLKSDGSVPSSTELAEHREAFGSKPQYSHFDGSFDEVKDYLEDRLNDPSSVEYAFWSKVVMTRRGWEVRCKYRVNNAFGAKILQDKIFTIRNDVVVSVRDR